MPFNEKTFPLPWQPHSICAPEMAPRANDFDENEWEQNFRLNPQQVSTDGWFSVGPLEFVYLCLGLLSKLCGSSTTEVFQVKLCWICLLTGFKGNPLGFPWIFMFLVYLLTELENFPENKNNRHPSSSHFPRNAVCYFMNFAKHIDSDFAIMIQGSFPPQVR